MFSSKLPPRTLYCELSSLFELTPVKVSSSDSMPPVALGMRRYFEGSSTSLVEVWMRCATTSMPSISVDAEGSSTVRCSTRPVGRRVWRSVS